MWTRRVQQWTLSGRQSDGTWICSTCTHHNTALQKRCAACSAREPPENPWFGTRIGTRDSDSKTVERCDERGASPEASRAKANNREYGDRANHSEVKKKKKSQVKRGEKRSKKLPHHLRVLQSFCKVPTKMEISLRPKRGRDALDLEGIHGTVDRYARRAKREKKKYEHPQKASEESDGRSDSEEDDDSGDDGNDTESVENFNANIQQSQQVVAEEEVEREVEEEAEAELQIVVDADYHDVDADDDDDDQHHHHHQQQQQSQTKQHEQQKRKQVGASAESPTCMQRGIDTHDVDAYSDDHNSQDDCVVQINDDEQAKETQQKDEESVKDGGSEVEICNKHDARPDENSRDEDVAANTLLLEADEGKKDIDISTKHAAEVEAKTKRNDAVIYNNSNVKFREDGNYRIGDTVQVSLDEKDFDNLKQHNGAFGVIEDIVAGWIKVQVQQSREVITIRRRQARLVQSCPRRLTSPTFHDIAETKQPISHGLIHQRVRTHHDGMGVVEKVSAKGWLRVILDKGGVVNLRLCNISVTTKGDDGDNHTCIVDDDGKDSDKIREEEEEEETEEDDEGSKVPGEDQEEYVYEEDEVDEEIDNIEEIEDREEAYNLSLDNLPNEVAENQSQGRSRRQSAGVPWNCLGCSFMNKWLSTTCSVCHAPRPKSYKQHDLKCQLDFMKAHQAQILTASNKSKSRKKMKVIHEKTPSSSSSSLFATSRETRSGKRKSRKAENSFLVTLAHVANQEMKQSDKLQQRRCVQKVQAPEMHGRRSNRMRVPTLRACAASTLRFDEYKKTDEKAKKSPSPSDAGCKVVGGSKSSSTSIIPDSNTENTLTSGTIIRYLFENLASGGFAWYTGIIDEAWGRGDWYNVLFQDAEQLWVRLKPIAEGQVWTRVTSRLRSERNLFEANLTAINPALVSVLHKTDFFRKSPSQTNDDNFAGGEACTQKRSRGRPPSHGRDRGHETGRGANSGEVLGGTSLQHYGGKENGRGQGRGRGRERGRASVPSGITHVDDVAEADRFEDFAEEDKDFGIIASSVAPENWTHPLCVNSLGPTMSVTGRLHTTNVPPEALIIGTDEMMSGVTRNEKELTKHQMSISISAGHQNNLEIQKLAGRPLSLLQLRNGEYFAILKQDCETFIEMYPTSDHWVQCDQCTKWRRVSESTAAQVKARPLEKWYCHFNESFDPSQAKCDADEQVEAYSDDPQFPTKSDDAANATSDEQLTSEELTSVLMQPCWVSELEDAYQVCLNAERKGDMEDHKSFYFKGAIAHVRNAHETLRQYTIIMEQSIGSWIPAYAANNPNSPEAQAYTYAIQEAKWLPNVEKIRSTDSMNVLYKLLRSFIFGARRKESLPKASSISLSRSFPANEAHIAAVSHQAAMATNEIMYDVVSAKLKQLEENNRVQTRQKTMAIRRKSRNENTLNDSTQHQSEISIAPTQHSWFGVRSDQQESGSTWDAQQQPLSSFADGYSNQHHQHDQVEEQSNYHLKFQVHEKLQKERECQDEERKQLQVQKEQQLRQLHRLQGLQQQLQKQQRQQEEKQRELHQLQHEHEMQQQQQQERFKRLLQSHSSLNNKQYENATMSTKPSPLPGFDSVSQPELIEVRDDIDDNNDGDYNNDAFESQYQVESDLSNTGNLYQEQRPVHELASYSVPSEERESTQVRSYYDGLLSETDKGINIQVQQIQEQQQLAANSSFVPSQAAYHFQNGPNHVVQSNVLSAYENTQENQYQPYLQQYQAANQNVQNTQPFMTWPQSQFVYAPYAQQETQVEQPRLQMLQGFPYQQHLTQASLLPGQQQLSVQHSEVAPQQSPMMMQAYMLPYGNISSVMLQQQQQE